MTVAPNVAVLGAGMQGTTIALELARRGCHVDLFDRGERPITRAGVQNEGKLHLGFLYAKDPSLRTADRLAAGALRFLPLIRRWAGAEAARIRFSTPYIYAVPADSMLTPDAIHQHFSRVEQRVRQVIQRHEAESRQSAYPGLDAHPLFRPLSETEQTRYFSPQHVVAAFATSEIAVDSEAVAHVLRAALAKHPSIRFYPRTRVESVAARGLGYTVQTSPAADRSPGGYDHVVNALWDGRLPIDRDMGLAPGRDWLWRYKVGFRMSLSAGSPDIASVTFMLGPYGDTVRYPPQTAYVSWYPACLLGMSSALSPPPSWSQCMADGTAAVMTATFDALARLYPDVALLPAATARLERTGGVIFAWGKTDVDDPASALHTRFDVGVRSAGGYHSVDTGKYTMAPALAMDVADRIAPDPSPART